jgi:hypothetical protein
MGVLLMLEVVGAVHAETSIDIHVAVVAGAVHTVEEAVLVSDVVES